MHENAPLILYAANVITLANEEDGVAHMLKRLMESIVMREQFRPSSKHHVTGSFASHHPVSVFSGLVPLSPEECIPHQYPEAVRWACTRKENALATPVLT